MGNRAISGVKPWEALLAEIPYMEVSIDDL
jgi:hypothetical protein